MKDLRPRRFWTPHEIRTLARYYPHRLTADVARRLKRQAPHVYAKASSLGLRKSAAFLASPAAHRLDGEKGRGTRFNHGHIPWNKGIAYEAGGRSIETRFKPGQRSVRWDSEIYCIGALRINSDGGLDMKLHDGPRCWQPLSRYVWATERGPIPRGLCVRFANGDGHDTRIENLYLATRANLMRANTVHNYPKPIALAVQLRGALNRRINRMEREHAAHA